MTDNLPRDFRYWNEVIARHADIHADDVNECDELRAEVERLKQVDAARFELFKARNEEIERLRAALELIAGCDCPDCTKAAHPWARAALGRSKEC